MISYCTRMLELTPKWFDSSLANEYTFKKNLVNGKKGNLFRFQVHNLVVDINFIVFPEICLQQQVCAVASVSTRII